LKLKGDKTQERPRWNRTCPEIAELLGVSEDTVHNYVKQGAPKIAHNEYDERAFVPWVIALHKKRDTESLAEAQARLTNHKADLAELELQEKRGEVVTITRIRDEYQRVVSAVRSRLLTVPAVAAARVVSVQTEQEVQRILDEHIHAALAELGSPSFIPTQSMAPTPTPDREPVGRRKPRVESRGKRRTGKLEHV
jgi:terminase small subunit / prophage DNA-packing protein